MTGVRVARRPGMVRWLTQIFLLALGLGLTILAMQAARADNRPSSGPTPSAHATPRPAGPALELPNPRSEDGNPPAGPWPGDDFEPPPGYPEPPIVEPDGLDRVKGFVGSPEEPTGVCPDAV